MAKKRFGASEDEQSRRQADLKQNLAEAAQRRIGQRQVGGTGGVPGGFGRGRGRVTGGGFGGGIKGGPAQSPLVRARNKALAAKVGEYGGKFKGLPAPGQGGVKIDQTKFQKK